MLATPTFFSEGVYQMKKPVMLSVMSVVLSCIIAFGEDQQTPHSFYEVSEYRHRYPDTDTNIDLYKRSWNDSHQHIMFIFYCILYFCPEII